MSLELNLAEIEVFVDFFSKFDEYRITDRF
jgi:hypothetical protein